MIITVNVTEDHILNGDPEDGCRCPLALAIKDVLPASEPFVIGGFYPKAELEVWGHKAEASLPIIAVHFMNYYDSCKWVNPFSFELDIKLI